ncbi:hypothetical protein [Lysinibacillus sp. NPDC086135]|uniref:hypothetical protein n=1 Tax=Lysinibacillus sp. NPDC086135 TaxID=3364130 RepID=UPI003825B592
MKKYEYHEDNQTYISISIDNDYMVHLYNTVGYESASVTMTLDEMKDMVKSLQNMINISEKEITDKEWSEWDLKNFLSQTHYFREEEEFELTCIEKGFEKTEFGTYKKVY